MTSLFRMIFFLLFVVLSSNTSLFFAEEDSTKSLIPTLEMDLSSLWHDGAFLITSPLYFKEKQWIETGAILAGTIVLFTTDGSVRSLALRNQYHITDNFAEVGRQYGREIYGLSLSGGLYVGGLVIGSEDVRLTGLLLFESIAFAGITSTVLKSVLGRSRPYEEEGPYRFHGLQYKLETTSMPSGHSTVAFAVSSVLAERIKNVYATVGLYSLATLTAVSRVYNDEHWFSDTFLGAVIGTVTSLAIANLHTDTGDRTSFRIIPTQTGLRAEIIF